jgi:hypothetical protein
MSEWGIQKYGDPCRECGFDWSTSLMEAMTTAIDAPKMFKSTIGVHPGSTRHPDLEWSLSAYVSHIADNLRVFAERIAGIALGAPASVPPYDQDELARVRGYDQISIEGALWSLDHSVTLWHEAVSMALDGANGRFTPFTMEHPERGPQSLLDVVRDVTHDFSHHFWDVQRTVESAEGPKAGAKEQKT